MDGDREELHSIRHQLAGLKSSVISMQSPTRKSATGDVRQMDARVHSYDADGNNSSARSIKAQRIRQQIDELLSSGMYLSTDEPVVKELISLATSLEASQ